MPVSSRHIIKAIEADGWFNVGRRGSHHHFKHPTKPGKVTVVHPLKDSTIGVIKDIENKTGLRLRK